MKNTEVVVMEMDVIKKEMVRRGVVTEDQLRYGYRKFFVVEKLREKDEWLAKLLGKWEFIEKETGLSWFDFLTRRYAVKEGETFVRNKKFRIRTEGEMLVFTVIPPEYRREEPRDVVWMAKVSNGVVIIANPTWIHKYNVSELLYGLLVFPNTFKFFLEEFLGAKYFWMEGAIVGKSSGFSDSRGRYKTVRYGWLDEILVGADVVEENGEKWIKVYESVFRGDPQVPGVYEAIYVKGGEVELAKKIIKAFSTKEGRR